MTVSKSLNKIYILTIFTVGNLSLQAESYSSHRLDDALYNEGGGRNVSVSKRIQEFDTEISKSISESGAKEKVSNNHWKVDLYSQAKFRSQKGGLSEDKESRYEALGAVEPELLWKNNSYIQPFVVLAPKIGAVQSQIVKNEKFTIYDFEGIAGISLPFVPGNTFLQTGRGFQRLDKYGLVFNSRMNFVELGVNYEWLGNTFGFSLLSGNYSSDTKTFTTSDYKEQRRNIWGGNLNFQKKKGMQAYGNLYYYRSQSNKQIPTYFDSFEPLESISYLGADLGTNIGDSDFYIELGGNSLQTYQNLYLPDSYQSITENKKALYTSYGKFGWKDSNWRFELAGLVQSKEGYYSLSGPLRIMGGDSSILLGWNTYSPRWNEFKPGLQMGGVFLNRAYSMFGISGWHTSLFLNSANIEIGRGYEGILHFTKKGLFSKSEDANFLLASVAYANVIPREKVAYIIDEIQKDQDAREYLKFYFSLGFKF